MESTRLIGFRPQQEQEQVIAQGALTNSKHPDRFVGGVYPTHLKHGLGATVYDHKNRSYIDYICGLGSNLFGYGNKRIAERVFQEYSSGSCLSLSTLTELEAGKKVKDIFNVERVKFLKDGTGACNAAIRMARNYSGRIDVLSEGYHGWGDEFISLTPPAAGIPHQRHIHPFIDIEQITTEIAAVIIEPVQLDDSQKRIDYLCEIQERCKKLNVVLIFDEIITGFRYPKYSVTNRHNLYPDMILLGKAIGGGLPLSAVAGKAEILDMPDYFVSSTFAGEKVALGAFLVSCYLLESPSTNYSLDNLCSKGHQFKAEFNTMWPEAIRIEGYSLRGAFRGSSDVIYKFWEGCVENGVLFGPSWFYCFDHPAQDFYALEVCKDVIMKMKRTGNLKLKGKRPIPSFSNAQRR